ncbi:MAG: hypothetical protein ACREEM_06910 [Blastocatellia bacterium]
MNFQPVLRAVVCAALVALSLSAGRGGTSAAGDDTGAAAVRYRPGVRNAPGKQRLNAGQLKRVLLSLREKTGWQSLAFDEAGFLVCPDPQVFNDGSAAARRLLGAALSGAEAYELENHNASPDVSFARLALGMDSPNPHTSAIFSVYPVQLDFADFSRLRGDRPACQAFDLGVAILHELAHGVWQLRDAEQAGAEPGECEAYINQIRRELRLPERQTYQARAHLGSLIGQFSTQLIAELHFVSAGDTPGQAKPKRYRLQWEAERVGPVALVNRAAQAGPTVAFR